MSAHEDFTYEYLSGIVNVPLPAPQSWEKDGLYPFYHNPNNPEWGESLCRVLYHETLHFWQFLSSGYIANLVGEQWHRLNYFESTGKINPTSDQLTYFSKRRNDQPFSAYELVECWARYWDVHTRSPSEIIKQEKINIGNTKIEKYETGELPGYSGEEFDLVMQNGRDCTLYAMPYRWALDTADDQSFLVNSIFPQIVNAAFMTEDPVGNFCEMFTLAIGSSELKKEIMSLRRPNVNLSWLTNWSAIHEIAINPIFLKKQIQTATGLDVIENTLLSKHPIFSEYLKQFSPLRGHIAMLSVDPASPHNEFIKYVTGLAIAYAKENMWIVFALPGEPTFRTVLGEHMTPPIIRFSNFTYYTSKPAINKILQLMGKTEKGDDTYKNASEELLNRIKRFEDAEGRS